MNNIEPDLAAVEMMNNAANSVCPRCAAVFVCGISAGGAHCWCMDLPPSGLPVSADASCLCPACLAQVRTGKV